jgi:2-keto-4-pentenoate hydratase
VVAPAGIAQCADRLWQAQASRSPISPQTDDNRDLTVTDAYAIQAQNIERRIAAGRVIRGRKVGLTSRPMQQLAGVSEPDFGVLLDDVFIEDGDEIPLETLVQPRVEAKLAFMLGRNLAGPGVTPSAALSAISGVAPAIEIADSRIADWRLQIVDTISDNASSRLLFVGGRLTPVTDVDLRLVGMVLTRNGQLIETGAGASALGNPARCVARLANKLSSFGTALHEGDVILPGALHRMVPVRPGDVFRAVFAHLGAVTARFSSRGGSS